MDNPGGPPIHNSICIERTTGFGTPRNSSLEAKPGDPLAWTKSFRFHILVDNDPKDIRSEELCSFVKEVKPPGFRRCACRREEPCITRYRSVAVASGSLTLRLVVISQDHLILTKAVVL